MFKLLKSLIPMALILSGCGATTTQSCPQDITSYYDINDFIHYADINGIMGINFNEYNSYFDNTYKNMRGWYSVLEDTSRKYAVEFYFYQDLNLVEADDIDFITYPLLKEESSYGYRQEIGVASLLGVEASTRTTYYGLAGTETPYYYELSLIKDNRLYYIQFSDSDDWNITPSDQAHLHELFTLFINRIEACKARLG